MRWICLPLLAAAAATCAPVDRETLNGKLILGYRGWFACPGDGGPSNGWVHWFARNSAGAAATTFDMLPDVSELEPVERCRTPWVTHDGKPVELFSSQNPKTVERHFRWMKEHGIDGVALQRFVAGLQSEKQPALDRVLASVRAAAERHGRVFFIMYDVAGAGPAWAAIYRSLDVNSPWTVGRFRDDSGADRYRREAEPRRSASNQIPRNCGRFYWRQVTNTVQAGATKSGLPAEPPFVSLDADGCRLPSDWYLQLAGKTSALPRGEIDATAELPLKIPGENK